MYFSYINQKPYNFIFKTFQQIFEIESLNSFDAKVISPTTSFHFQSLHYLDSKWDYVFGHCSFTPTELKKFGFFEDWNPNPKYNLCAPGTEKSKVDAFINFMNSKAELLICTHATLRFAFDAIE